MVEGAGAYKVTFYSDGEKTKTCFTYKNEITVTPETSGKGACSFTVRTYPQKNSNSISAESTACAAE